MSFPKPYADAVARMRVPGGFVMMAAFLWLSSPSAKSLAWGVPVSLLGLALRGWAAGHLEKNTTLTVSGPYAWVRNPLYLGTLATAAGLAIAALRWELGVLFAAVFLLIYLPVVELEEQHLRYLFPAFAEYERSVAKLVPHLPKTHGTADGSTRGTKPFRWSIYWRNEEYQAALGYVAALGVLVWKVYR